MKKQTSGSGLMAGTFFWLLFSFLCFSFNSSIAQQVTSSEGIHNPHIVKKDHSGDFDENKFREALKEEGLSPAVIDEWVKKRKLQYAEAQNSLPVYKSQQNQSANTVGTCADMGVENGWSAWEASTGYSYWPLGGDTFDVSGLVPTAPRFVINSGAGIDPCTPGPNPGDPSLPFVAPGFGNYSIQLGQTAANGNMGGCNGGPYGGCAERLTYNLQVTPQDTNFVYAYAVILENPCPPYNPHNSHQVPYASIYILSQNGDTIPCSYHKYMGDTTGSCTPSAASGMYAASCLGSGGSGGNGYDVAYQPWTMANINLAAYVGQVVKIVISNVDCALGVHYCYSYWDFKCTSVSVNTVPFCAGQQTTIVGPPSTGATYTWYQNHHQYTGLPSATLQTITPTPAVGDTFSVHVQQPAGCSFWMTFVPEATTIIPDFNFTGTCGNMSFNDSSTVLPLSATNTVTAWNWQFPGGAPGNSTTQNPGTIIYPSGTYTVTLIVTSTAGCKDTIHHSFTVGGLLTLMNQTNAWCGGGGGGSASVTVSGGNPGYTYSWNNGATTSQISNLASGNYTITVIDGNGCTKSDTVSVSSTGSITVTANNSTICAGQSATLTASGGINYSWSTGATTSSITPVATTNSTYSVIVSSGSCADTAFASLTVNPSPSVSLGNNQTLCSGQSISLDAGNPGAGYLWSTGATTQSINVSGAGTYWVIVALNNCLAKDTVKTFTPPTVQLFDSSLCTISPIILDPGSGATSYLWSNGSTSQTIAVDVAGNYWVEVMFGNCRTADTAKITGDGTGGTLYVPNAFTPNEDHINEIFLAKGTGVASFDMSIFDRWGNLIFTSDDVNKGWDGKIQGGHYILKGDGQEAAQEDVYVWKIDYTTQCFPHQVKKEMGRVTLVK